MTDKPLPDHETLERVLKTAPTEILDTLPKTTESERARFPGSEMYRYAKEARERAKVIDREATTEAAAPQWIRGPALAGWPWRPD